MFRVLLVLVDKLDRDRRYGEDWLDYGLRLVPGCRTNRHMSTWFCRKPPENATSIVWASGSRVATLLTPSMLVVDLYITGKPTSPSISLLPVSI